MSTLEPPAAAQLREGAADPATRVGPLEWITIVFPAEGLTPQVTGAIAALVDPGPIHIVDLLLVRKLEDGTARAWEFDELSPGETALLESIEGDVLNLLSENDIPIIAAELEPGSSALVVVWENLWAAPIGAAVEQAGGFVLAHERIVADDFIAGAVQAALRRDGGRS